MDIMTGSLMAAVSGLTVALCYVFRRYEKAQDERIKEQKNRYDEAEKHEKVLAELLELLKRRPPPGGKP